MEPKASNSRGALPVVARGGILSSFLSQNYACSTVFRPAHKASRVEGRHREEVEDDEEGHLIYKPGDTLQGRYVVKKLSHVGWVSERYSRESSIL